jgi:hypothetical protein
VDERFSGGEPMIGKYILAWIPMALIGIINGVIWAPMEPAVF